MITKTQNLMAGAMAVLMVTAPAAAMAQESYDGYCYAKNNKTTGTIIGAVAGGVAGSQVSKNERGLGALIGAVAGGALGRKIASDSTKCLNGEYYSYQSNAYEPLAAPDGYDVVYFKTRPRTSAYSVVYFDTNRRTTPGYAYNTNSGYQTQGQPYYNNTYDRAYNTGTAGWRDDKGVWRTGRPVALGWKDSRGRWHEGQVQTYGSRDSNGVWREEAAPNYGYNYNGN
ncbi:glycine zipper 2TM domain-containing protein [Asticcacaulis sp. AC402]|uniref:glycine zipper 2TM domain-containing protein n=1 Tax=Asticcacaulis sp. AC402 TaxID=1282361 RepID=UPI0003C3DF58|nr:glycine zipper 2TM domain-containing protein [Asticcacaulis sp. AC402]ESQ74562.1 hypothetical protein ABAC402_13830 [Asticcacaulis sp. AC402]